MNLGTEIWKSSEAPQRYLAIQQPGELPKGEFCFDISSVGLDVMCRDHCWHPAGVIHMVVPEGSRVRRCCHCGTIDVVHREEPDRTHGVFR